MNNTLNTSLTAETETRIPGWAFLFGWLFLLSGSIELIHAVIQCVLIDEMATRASHWERTIEIIWSSWELLINLAIIVTGILLLRNPSRGSTAIGTYAALIAFDMLFIVTMNVHRAMNDSFTLHLFAFMATGAFSAIAISLLFFWFASKVKSLPHPDVSSVILLLITMCIYGFFNPLAYILFETIEYTTGTGGINSLESLVINLAKLPYPIILAFCTAAVYRHPVIIRKQRIFYIILATLILLGISAYFVATIMDPPGYEWGRLYALYSFMYNFARYPLPLILLIIMTRRYMTSFHLAENYKYGLNNCVNCSYNLTGNTSGICPECGSAIQSEFNPEKEPPTDEQPEHIQ